MNRIKLMQQIMSSLQRKEFEEIIKSFKVEGEGKEVNVSISFDLSKSTTSSDTTDDLENFEEEENVVVKEEEKDHTPDPEPNKTEEQEVESLVAAPQPVKEVKFCSKDGSRTLYGDHEFTDDECTYIKAYLSKELKKSEAAECLDMTAYEFEKLVNRYKRVKNLDKPKHSGFDYSTVDFDRMYSDITKHGDSIIAIAKDLGCPASYLGIKFRTYCKEHNLVYVPTSGCKAGQVSVPVKNEEKPAVQQQPKQEEAKKPVVGVKLNPAQKKPVVGVKLTAQIPKQVVESNNDPVKESIQAKKKWESMIGKKVDSPDGWLKMEDGVIHKIKDGIVVR